VRGIHLERLRGQEVHDELPLARSRVGDDLGSGNYFTAWRGLS
jgi:hypothetical protein